ncbi:MAG: ABC transporter permease, partial [bacterium]
MFKNYIMIAIRNLRRQKGYSFINILGLAIGMACCLLILLYVQDEFGYDKFHEKSDRIYRLVMEGQVSANERTLNSARSPSPWAPVLAADYPGVVNYVRFKTPLSRWLITYEDERIYEKGFYFADATVFDVFDFELVRGNPAEVLVAPNTVVISEETARKYFGNEDPVGKIITADLVFEFKITGVMKKVPRSSHMTFDFLASFATLTGAANSEGNFIYGGDLSNFQFFGLNPQVYTYLLLDDGFSAEEFELLLPQFIDKYLGEQIRQSGIQLDPYLQPLTAVHLHSNLDAEVAPNSDISYVYIFSAISFFILIIACINFMNLATARSANRALEVGLRKVVGSDRFQLVKQFLGESVFLAFLALLLAIIFVYFLLPPFNVLSGKELVFAFDNTWIFPALIGIVLFVGIVAGSYPAFFLSSFKPV